MMWNLEKTSVQVPDDSTPWDDEIYDEAGQLALPEGGLWHAAPTQERARIMQHGLQTSSPAYNPRWTGREMDEPGLDWEDTWLKQQPVGVYGVPHLDDTDVWASDPSDPDASWDIWHIPQDQIQQPPVHDNVGSAWVIPHGVRPTLHTKAEDAFPYWPHENEGNSFAPELANPGVQIPDAERGRRLPLYRKRYPGSFAHIASSPCPHCGDQFAGKHPDGHCRICGGDRNDKWRVAPIQEHYYHYAPTTERDRILQHGLQVSNPDISEHWPNEHLDEQPPGVYVTKDQKGKGGMYTQPMDRWRVPSHQIRHMTRDPLLNAPFDWNGSEVDMGSYVIHHPVHPELDEPYEMSDRSKLFWQGQEAMQTGEEDPGRHWRYDLADAEDEKSPLSNQSWWNWKGIGKPDRVIGRVSYELKDCGCGRTHWGPEGAAGLLLRHVDDTGQDRYYLQQRSPHVLEGGTYSTPGGALEPGEHPQVGAMREGAEELGALPPHSNVRTVARYDCGHDWKYHTVMADVQDLHDFGSGDRMDPKAYHEHADGGWYTPKEMKSLPLHPGFMGFYKNYFKQAKMANDWLPPILYHWTEARMAPHIASNGFASNGVYLTEDDDIQQLNGDIPSMIVPLRVSIDTSYLDSESFGQSDTEGYAGRPGQALAASGNVYYTGSIPEGAIVAVDRFPAQPGSEDMDPKAAGYSPYTFA